MSGRIQGTAVAKRASALLPVLLALAAAQNGRAAQAYLAEMYAQGLGIERDDSEALRLAEGVRRQCRLH